MRRVRCTLPNAGDAINGVAFYADGAGKVSESIDRATAERFLSIPGYELVEADAGDTRPDGEDAGDIQSDDEALGEQGKQPEPAVIVSEDKPLSKVVKRSKAEKLI